jgi:G3E family GTPase
MDAVLDPALDGRLAIDGVFCLIDAAGFRELDFAATELAIDQASAADVILLNKCDIAGPEDLASVEATLLGPLPHARLLRTRFAEVPREILLGLEDRAAPPRRPSRHHDHDHHGHDHGEEFEAWSWRSEAPLDRARFRAAIRQLPATLLRAKGVLVFDDRPGERAVFQLVGRRHTIEVDDGAPPATSVLVAIARTGSLDADALTALLDGCRATDQRR